MSDFLDKITSDRRQFVQRILGMSGFAVPVVRSLLLTSAGAAVAERANAIPLTTLILTTTTTTVAPITTPAPTTTPAEVPEIDPGSAGAALTLLTGAALLARGYQSKKNVAESQEPGKDEADKKED